MGRFAMSTGLLLLVIITLSVAGYLAGRRVGLASVAGGGVRLVSLPVYHGTYVALSILLPSLVLLFAWVALEPTVIRWLVLDTLAPVLGERTQAEISLIYSRITGIGVVGLGDGPREQEAFDRAAALYSSLRIDSGNLMIMAVLSVAGIGGLMAARQLRHDFRARERVERIVLVMMVICAIVAILTTLGILASLIGESWRFFSRVPVDDFLFGLRWSPQEAIREDQVGSSGAFGALPLMVGTLLIAAIALLVAVPLGLLSAIYLAEYATARVRSTVKPVLEILAGIPSVVYGFFALLVLGPLFPQVDAWWRDMMDDGVAQVLAARLAPLDEQAAQAGVPVVLANGVIELRAGRVAETVDRLSNADATLILERGLDLYRIQVTPANAVAVAGLLPDSQRDPLVARLNAITQEIAQVNTRFVAVIDNDPLFAVLRQPPATDAVERRARNRFQRLRDDAVSRVNGLIDLPAAARNEAISDLLARLDLSRTNPYRLARARIHQISDEATRARLRRQVDGREQGELLTLQGLQARVQALDVMNAADRAALVQRIGAVMSVPPDLRAAELDAIGAALASSLARDQAKAAAGEVDQQLTQSSRAAIGLSEAVIEATGRDVLALAAAETGQQAAVINDILVRLSTAGVPADARRDVERRLTQLQGSFGGSALTAEAARRAFQATMGDAADPVDEILAEVEARYVAAARQKAAEATLAQIMEALQTTARAALVTEAERAALLASVEEIGLLPGAKHTAAVAALTARVAGIEGMAPADQDSLVRLILSLDEQILRAEASGRRLAADIATQVNRLQDQLETLDAAIAEASPPAAAMPAPTALQQQFEADYQRLDQGRRLLISDIEAAARTAQPMPEGLTLPEGFSFYQWLFGIFGYVLLGAQATSAMAAGLVMGVMIVPLVASLSDDVINAVPQSLRDGSAALGATASETTVKVVLPAALPGIVGAILLAASRAIGETMIVVMAAGFAAPNLVGEALGALNPFAETTTITVQIADLLTGDQEFDSAKTLSAFALALLLFVVTLGLNLVSLRIVKKYRERYD